MASFEAGRTRAGGPRTRQAIPAYVINLDRRPDRWEAISGNLARLGLEAERVPAVDARTVTNDELGRWLDLTRPLFKMGRGSQATFLSHIRAFDRFLDSASPAALFLQDDAELASDLPAFLDTLDWWPERAGLVKLEAHSKARRRYFSPECAPRYRGRQFRRISLWGPSAAGFMVDRDAARTIRFRCIEVQMPIDHFLFNLRVSPVARELRPVQILPALVRQRGGAVSSDITPLKRADRLPLRARLRRHCMSAPRKAMAVGAWLAGYGAKVPVEFADTCGGDRE